MPKPSALIITTDTLRAIGAKHMLESLFDIAAHIAVDNDNESIADDMERCDIIFADERSSLSYLDLLIPKKAKTVILTDKDASRHLKSWLHVNTDADSDHLVEEITLILKHIKRNNLVRMELSTRETDVLRLMAHGLTNKEIADNLNISINTVLSHRKNISAKLGIKSVSGLCVYAMMNGIIN